MNRGKTLVLMSLILASAFLSLPLATASTETHAIPFHGMHVKWQGVVERDDNGTRFTITYQAVLEGVSRDEGFRLRFTEWFDNQTIEKTFLTTDDWRLLKKEDTGELFHSPFWIEPRVAAGSIIPMWEVERGFPLSVTIAGRAENEVLGQKRQCIAATWNITEEQHNGDRFIREIKGTLLFESETGILLSQDAYFASELWFGEHLQMSLKENRKCAIVETNIPNLASSSSPPNTGSSVDWRLSATIAGIAFCGLAGGYIYIKKRKPKIAKTEEANETPKPGEENATLGDDESLAEWFKKKMKQ